MSDLPSSFLLADGTPAKPLGDWRTLNLIKDPRIRTLLYVIQHTRALINHFQHVLPRLLKWKDMPTEAQTYLHTYLYIQILGM